MIAQECSWLQLTAASSLCRLLQRLGISRKRGRDYVHSPDRHYSAKCSVIELARLRAFYAPERFVLVYVDQMGYYRQPPVAAAYEARGPVQPLARRSHRSNSCFRVMGALNCMTGQVTYRQRSHISRFVVSDFWQQLYEDYPAAETIYAVVDNWPVHFHPDALARLQPQELPWPRTLPSNWPKVSTSRVVQDSLPIQLLCLPTYASWLNPIEKLWRWLKQDIIHLHHCSDDWPGLKQEVAAFLDQFQDGSRHLLRYVGLLPV